MKSLDAEYWNSRYMNQETGWDLGEVSPPLKDYIDQIEDKDLKILIPGAGNAYEAVYLLQNGFKNVTVVDFAKQALTNLQARLTNINPQNYQLVASDFFEHHGSYDLVLEQTFFCAIHPHLRKNYVNHSHQLLAENGKIAGLMFSRVFPFEGPPFGGSEQEYKELFESKFTIKKMETAYNSMEPRQGSELFVLFVKK